MCEMKQQRKVICRLQCPHVKLYSVNIPPVVLSLALTRFFADMVMQQALIPSHYGRVMQWALIELKKNIRFVTSERWASYPIISPFYYREQRDRKEGHPIPIIPPSYPIMPPLCYHEQRVEAYLRCFYQVAYTNCFQYERNSYIASYNARTVLSESFQSIYSLAVDQIKSLKPYPA